MARVNLTLDRETFRELDAHAKRVGKPKARAATDLVRAGLERQQAAERRTRLVRDYAAQHADAGEALRDLEAGQLELLGDEDD